MAKGSVHLRKDGRWEGRIVVGYDERGYPKTKNVLAKTKRECQKKLRVLEKQCTPVRTSEPRSAMSFGQWMDHWYRTCCLPGIRPNTRTAYEAAIYRHILPELGETPLDKLTQTDLQQFYSRLKSNGRVLRREIYGSGLSNRSVRSCHAICRAALNKAVELGLIPVNPAEGCKLPPKKTREMQVLAREELQRLLIQAKEDGCYELLLLELSTGLRRGELLALHWTDLDWDTGALRINKQVGRIGGKLTVSQPKTRAAVRTLLLPVPVVEMLAEYRKGVHSRWMFPSPVKEDLPLDPASVRKKLTAILERADCKHVRFHDLRHTFATSALAHGMDVKTLSAAIGHVSAATTLDIYTHTTGEMQARAAERIDCGLGNRKPSRRKKAPPQEPAMTDFQAQKGSRRKPGTGCVTQINDHLWEGRYNPNWPDGKKHARNVYAHSLEECEEKLTEIILQVKAEIAQIKGETDYAE